MRRWTKLRLADLAKLRISLKKVSPFVITADHNPELKRLDSLHLENRVKPPKQLMLFEAGTSALTGEV